MSQPYYPVAPLRTRSHSGLAIASFAIGLLALLICWFPFAGYLGLMAVLFAIIAFASHQVPGQEVDKVLAIPGLILGVLATVAAVLWTILVLMMPHFSCPHVYAWDGQRYRLDADALSGSLFQGGESDDLMRLEHLQPADGRYRVRVADDLQELDHIDTVALRVVDHPQGSEALPMPDGTMVAVGGAQAPSSATDGQGRDVLGRVRAADGDAFVSSVEDFAPDPNTDPRELVTLELPRPADGDGRAILVLRAHNTPFAAEAFGQYLANMGPGLGPLLRWAQTNRSYAYRQRLDDEMHRLGLLLGVAVWAEGKWSPAAELKPLGPAILRTVAMPIELPPEGGATVRVRLAMTPLFWEIDQAALGRELPGAAQEQRVRPRSAQLGDGRDALGLLAQADASRVTLRPGEGVALEFDVPAAPAAGLERTIALDIRGYYEFEIGGHRWLDALAVMAHRSGRDSLPRYALRLARQRAHSR